MKKISVLAMVLCIIAFDDSAAQVLNAEILVADTDDTDALWHSDNIVPYFRFIPGSISGNPINDDILTVSIEDQLVLTIDLSDWEDKAKNEALPLSEAYVASGVKIEPTTARLLRVGTFAYDFDHEIGLLVGFQDAEKDGAVVLLYVTEPCRIFGSLTYEDTDYSLDMTFDEDGFHFVLVDSANRIENTEIEGQLVYLVEH